MATIASTTTNATGSFNVGTISAAAIVSGATLAATGASTAGNVLADDLSILATTTAATGGFTAGAVTGSAVVTGSTHAGTGAFTVGGIQAAVTIRGGTFTGSAYSISGAQISALGATITGRVVFVEVFDTASGDSTVAKWQNGFPGETVDGYEYLGFAIREITDTVGSKQAAVALEIPWQSTALTVLRNSVASSELVTIELYGYEPTPTGVPPTTFDIVANFVGQVLKGDANEASAVYQIGSSLQLVGQDSARRIYTSPLVGQLAEV